ncbi:ligand-binding sensor domain-containing protein [Myxococcus qinghaiensis]|uniref:hypothetical protein n=1 Tax=Myxococcus qinghaiensis TaxID=2906758 RepID=UPI0020A7F533|nr:hypothetical protein [Myxococcus qinghaiensis]MCP3162971.1 hypothetical protein [Myxococcus qinghaiensis]
MAGAMWTVAGCDSSKSGDESEQDNPGMDDPGPPPGRPSTPEEVPDAGTPTETPDSGTPTETPDSGTPTETPDSGTPTTDGGTPTTDGGTPTDPRADVEIPPLPTASGWRFYGADQGAPVTIYGVTADEGGNVWVAGGEEGLFVLKPGAEKFERFGMENGLRPYGFMADGSVPPGPKYLKVISVAGGKSGTVFVGYEGMPGKGYEHCENNWDGPSPDPARYKSGDADKVTLNADGSLNVVHYDIFSGPGVVAAETRGREKICNVLRIRYDKHALGNNKSSVWFGGNHGFARGNAEFEGAPMCNGQLNCSGVLEHVHPHINAYNAQGGVILLTDAYYGVAVDPSGDVWFGGSDRTTRFRYGTHGGNFWRAQTGSENDDSNKLDLWPDAKPDYSTPAERVPDNISGAVVAGDGSVWLTSFGNGLVRVDANGTVLGRMGAGSGLVDKHLSAIGLDPSDGSIWVGASWGGGLSRLKGGSITNYGLSEFGRKYGMSRISDIQADSSGSGRRMLVSFMGYQDTTTKKWVAGVIGIFEGN